MNIVRANKKIRWGIMGLGRIAGVFCDMLKELEQAEIYAVASRTIEKAESFGEKYHAVKCYGSYEELVKDENVDIIYIATPIGCHYEHAKLCLEAGKNVLCEKALTMHAYEAEELYALAKEKQLFFMEAVWSKCHPVYRKLMEWKKEGKFGQIQSVEARIFTLGSRQHRLLKKNEGGVLYDLTIYPLVYACSLLGYEPTEVRAMAVKDGEDVDVVDSVQLHYENGAFATLVGALSCERQGSLYIHGTEGKVLIHKERFHQAQYVELLDWNNQLIDSLDAPFMVNGYEYEALEAMKCLSEGRTESELIPMEETIALIRLMEECKRQWD